ncbi:hypothetical protein GE09DRAFT_357754 [Coniochaeta sp. 2T2.1]|nr:hypothetical protein GE09DRAFT_357754 [Coniochaeta sp. 2T2.1]
MDPNRPFCGIPSDPTHFHAEMGRVPDIHGPLSPPFSQYIPQWEKCGKHNCGNHHYQAAYLAPPLPDFAQPFTEHVRNCTTCNLPKNVVELHFLDCGHTFCRDCLNQMATRTHESIKAKKAKLDELIGNAFALEKAAEHAASAVAAGALEDMADAMTAEVFDMANLSCCRETIPLGSFLYCMDPAVALQCWLDIDHLNTPRECHNICGWPDCGAFVSDKCGFYPRGKGPVVLHCPSCRGNGQLIKRADPVAGPGRGHVWIPTSQPLKRNYTSGLL